LQTKIFDAALHDHPNEIVIDLFSGSRASSRLSGFIFHARANQHRGESLPLCSIRRNVNVIISRLALERR